MKAETLRQFRERHGVSLRRMGKELGLSHEGYRALEARQLTADQDKRLRGIVESIAWLQQVAESRLSDSTEEGRVV